MELDEEDLELLGWGRERRDLEDARYIVDKLAWFRSREAREGRRLSTRARNQRYYKKHKAELSARNRTEAWKAYQREWQRQYRARKKAERERAAKESNRSNP